MVRRRTVSFAREDDLERSVGVADADVGRADVWEYLARVIRAEITSYRDARGGRARGVWRRGGRQLRGVPARDWRGRIGAREEGKGKKGRKRGKWTHAHGRAAFVLAEAPDEEDEDEAVSFRS